MIGRRVIAGTVAAIYIVAGIIMVERSDFSWATVQFGLAWCSALTVLL